MLIFCFFLFNDKKKARPAGHDQLVACAKKTLGASRNKGKGSRARDAQGHVPYEGQRTIHHPQGAKTPMTRSNLREIAMHVSFALGENPQPAEALLDMLLDKDYYATLAGEDELYKEYPSKKEVAYLTQVATGLGEHLAELDYYIEKYAKDWKVGRISRVAVAIMRVSMFEILYVPDVPGSVAINEAVEMAKKYEEPNTVAFLNGILGSFIRGELTEDV
ncbi:MAG: transcription antitermination factor NusB [Oscillospiraceae bacterium]|nr:transcription antitermination factor NusB [Oscillospiraceae bacterium]